MDFTWADFASAALQILTAYMATRNHQKIGTLHECVDENKRTNDFHTDIIVELLKDIQAKVNRPK